MLAFFFFFVAALYLAGFLIGEKQLGHFDNYNHLALSFCLFLIVSSVV